VGFAATGETVQHLGEPLRVEAPAHVTWSESGDHANLVALDREASGHDRTALISSLSFAMTARFRTSLHPDLAVGWSSARWQRETIPKPRPLIDFLLAHHQGRFVRQTHVHRNYALLASSR